MSTWPKPKWIKNRWRGEVWFIDGDELAIAVPVKDTKTGRQYWQVDRVIAVCDGDYFHLMDARTDESYDDWDWGDVEWFMRINAHGPMTEKQAEEFQYSSGCDASGSLGMV